ncbi:hypothetical protein CR513_20693, partial [Mucuna pruriens]
MPTKKNGLKCRMYGDIRGTYGYWQILTKIIEKEQTKVVSHSIHVFDHNNIEFMVVEVINQRQGCPTRRYNINL